jgi:predicted ATPase with chaperone activity
MRVGEITQFCKLQEEGQSLMRATMPQLNLPARAYHRTQSVKLAGAIADMAVAFHASQLAEVDDGSRITQ